MFARCVGGVAATAIFLVYFAVIGAKPVLETLLGVGLAAVGGLWAWRETKRRLRRRQDGRQ